MCDEGVSVLTGCFLQRMEVARERSLDESARLS